jgi:hypothetical protein
MSESIGAAVKMLVTRLRDLGLDDDAIGRRLVDAGVDHMAKHAHCPACLNAAYIAMIESMQTRCVDQLDSCAERHGWHRKEVTVSGGIH